MKRGGDSVANKDKAVRPGKRPRGQRSSKMEAKRDATTLALQETLKRFITQKDKASEEKKEREERKHIAHMLNADIAHIILLPLPISICKFVSNLLP